MPQMTVVTLFCDKGEKYLHDYFMPGEDVPLDASTFR